MLYSSYRKITQEELIELLHIGRDANGLIVRYGASVCGRNVEIMPSDNYDTAKEKLGVIGMNVKNERKFSPPMDHQTSSHPWKWRYALYL